jgi:hypothetical protein
MHDLPHVESSQAPHNLNEDIPNFLLFYVCLPLLVVTDLLIEISIICKLHDQTQALTRIIDEGLFVTNDIGFIN